MSGMAAVALSSLAIALAAPTAFAEERSVEVNDDRVPVADFAVAARVGDRVVSSVDTGAPSFAACQGLRPTPSAASCQSTRHEGYNLGRAIDWRDVGPSIDDFAPTEDALRLQGARLVGRYRF